MGEWDGGVTHIAQECNLARWIPRLTRFEGASKHLHLVLGATQLQDSFINVYKDLSAYCKSKAGIREPFSGLIPATKRTAKKVRAIPPEGAVQLRAEVDGGRFGKIEHMQL